jgi:hypothetical protein
LLFFQPGWEESNNYMASIWTRDETNSWENSESSEYFVNSTAVNKQLAFPFPPSKFDWSDLWTVLTINISVIFLVFKRNEHLPSS